MTTRPQNNCHLVVRFSLCDPKRDLRLTAGEAQSFEALNVLKERVLKRRPVVSSIHRASDVRAWLPAPGFG